MWETANPTKIAATRGYGATVDLTSASAAASHELLLDTIERSGRTYVDPFDHPLVMAGQGTVGLELVEDVPDADVVVVPVGGGGLIAGVATAVKGRNPAVRVVGVEPEGAAGLTAALEAGRGVRIDPHTVADGLAPPFAGEHCLAVVQERVDEVVLVSDEEIKGALRFLYARAKLACEPAGAAATAALLAGKFRVGSGETVVSVVSGGNADPKIASGILASADES